MPCRWLRAAAVESNHRCIRVMHLYGSLSNAHERGTHDRRSPYWLIGHRAQAELFQPKPSYQSTCTMWWEGRERVGQVSRAKNESLLLVATMHVSLVVCVPVS